MIYVAGFIGFIGGFALGQIVLGYLLRSRTKEELLEDRSLRWKYGTLHWIIVFTSVYATIQMYHQFFE